MRLFLLVILSFFSLTQAQAAYLYLDPDVVDIFPGDTMTVAVRLDTEEGECVNAVDAVLEYSGSIQAVDVSRGNSILPIWLEEPTIDQDSRQISFAGGIPNGYCGRVSGDPRLTNILVELVFRAPGFSIGSSSGDDEAFIDFSDKTQVYLNDGFGTQKTPDTSGATVNLSKKPGPEIEDEWTDRVNADTQPPEEFSINLVSDISIYGGQYFITFNTTDKQSGIDHYEVIEESFSEFDWFSWGAADAPWVTVRSPYLLKDQSLNSTIRVKAIDKAGNEYVATLIPEAVGQKSNTVKQIALLFAGIVIIILLIVSIWWFRVRKKTQKENEQNSNNEGGYEDFIDS